MSQKEETIAAFDIRTFFKRWPKFYYFIATFFGPMFFCGLSSRGFLKKYKMSGAILNLGSGPRIIAETVTNVDIYPYGGVDVVAHLMSLPYEAGSVGGIICDNVLEHVDLPVKAVAEMHRVLAFGGLAYIATPFIYPFHSSPYDYQRWTVGGLTKLFEDFEIVEIGTRAGPFSAIDAMLCHTFAVIFSFGSPRIAAFLVNIFMFIFWPIKLLDFIFNYWPQSTDVASVLYCVVRKK